MKHILATNFIISLLILTGCGDEDKDKAVKSFTSVEECKAAIAADATQDERDKVVADCQKAYDQSKAEHERTAPHYTTLGECVDLYGSANCGLSPAGYYYPSMNGFMLGYLAGAMTYQPYYYNRWGVTYSGPTNLGYYRSGYVYVPRTSSTTWTRSYASTPVAHVGTPPPVTSTRGVFGGSAANNGHGISVTRPSITGNTSVASPSSSSSRGVFGASASSHISSFGSSSGG